MSTSSSHQAIVIGGSIAGLLAARVLADHFADVTVIDRDLLPDEAAPRRGVPQSVQPHVLFTSGYRIFAELFPGIDRDLDAAGAISFDWGRDFLCYQRGNWLPNTTTESGLRSYTCSRPLLESVLRRRVSHSRVKFVTEHKAIGLVGDRTAIRGVKLQAGDTIVEYAAQLVVDASGRSTQFPKWLQELGVEPPTATVIDPHLGYATRRYRLPAEATPAGKILLVGHEAPHQPRLGYLAQVEDRQWIATLGGYGRDYPPLDDLGFLKFARSLADSSFYTAIATAEPLSDILAHRATANRQYHYELSKLPDGAIAIGDAVCALCPVYGQGMTLSAMSALVLQRWLSQQHRHSTYSGRSFQKQLARSNAFAWSLATGSDSMFPTTTGAVKSNWLAKLFKGYGDRLVNLSQQDRAVHLHLLAMSQMLQPPSSLLHPRLLFKALM